ncbi:DUF3575 domain-containing protein [Salibacter sp.]|uniref:DUF3575 domain-containing protein n=1 Tax=Salibacter sp. TaxID=2010995 RepID=UPI0028704C1A|nr:outer membrane beta-barrel protein [Salibacter sp.]MDR9399310.1 DUF3575 domain-containing protein [Salibacter sp.]MDR9487756.1 DUF3575 domain-containing protein [Salibacter sp.]
MKKLIVLFFVACSTFSYSQNTIGKGSKMADFGVGLSTWGIPVYGGIEVGVDDNITVGGRLSWRSWNERYFGTGYRHNIFGFSVRGNYHLNEVLELPSDIGLYAGLNAGFYVYDSPSEYSGDRTSGIGLGVQIGGRYYFKDTWSLNAELGGGSSFSSSKIGLTKNF